MTTNKQIQLTRRQSQPSQRALSNRTQARTAYLLLAVMVVAVTALGAAFLMTQSNPATSVAEAASPAVQSAQDTEPGQNRAGDALVSGPSPTPTVQQVLLPTVTPDTLAAVQYVEEQVTVTVTVTVTEPVQDATPDATPDITPEPAQSSVFLPSANTALAESIVLSGITHEWQTWNNCGPATLSMALSYHGIALSQAEIGSVLRTNPEDKNVNPDELVVYARTQGLSAVSRVNGDVELLKRLLNYGLPVIVEVWLEPEPEDGFGHFRLLTGYDDETQRWIAYDSYVAENMIDSDDGYSGIYVSYEKLQRQWPVFNRSFIVLYPPEQQAQVETALHGIHNDEFMWQSTLERTQAEIDENPENVYAWFNHGTALVGLAQYEAAVEAYSKAQQIGLPWRMLWYQFGPLKAYYKTQRYQELLNAVDDTLATTVNVEELHYWQGMALASLGDVEGAKTALSTALALRPDYPEAQQALATLNP